jgi:pyruvate/2-oxoglutarate/acetoin dehydrogenase E1 component
MAPKPGNYAVLEAIQQAMKQDPNLTLLYEYNRPTAVSPLGQVIDLYAEFGPVRVPDWGPIDEEWFVGACAGMAMSGVKAIACPPSMTTVRAFELVFNQVGKLRHMTGGQANMPMVLWQQAAGRRAGSAGQHADAGQEALYAALPGVKVVLPANPYDAKGLMTAAIRDPDPVVFFHYSAINQINDVDVPDDEYVVEIGEAAIRQEGSDITIVGYGNAAIEINKAAKELAAAGISAEVIDPRTLKPMPVDAIVASAKKTGRLLAVDHGHETLSIASEVLARVAMAAPGTKMARQTFPDAPPPGSREMITWMTPDAPKIVDAAKKLVAA